MNLFKCYNNRLILKPISYLVSSMFRNNSSLASTSASTSILKQVQVLPVIRPCDLHPNGKIHLCKWNTGNYTGRYTGLIGTVPEPVIKMIDPNDDDDIKMNMNLNNTNSLLLLKNIGIDILPTHLRQYLINIELCAVLMFDGPPDNEEFVFISNLRSHGIENIDLTHTHLPYESIWFDLNKIPYSNMPEDDFHWYPKVLNGKKVRGNFIFGGLKELSVKKFHLEEVQNW